MTEGALSRSNGTRGFFVIAVAGAVIGFSGCRRPDEPLGVVRSAATTCAQDGDCGDGNVCTADSCNLTNHTCQHLTISDCCTKDLDCDDGASCTQDSCNVSQGRCQYTPVSHCCGTVAQCTDNNLCTV